jgi:nucleoside-diphosphate-sugar epimerase
LGYEIINLGGGNNPIALNTVIGMIEKMLGKKAIVQNKEFHIADIKETWANISKAERLLGWKPEISFEEGIKRSVEWHLSNKHLNFELN